MKFTVTKINETDYRITNDRNEEALIESFGQTVMTTVNSDGQTEKWDLTNDIRGYEDGSISPEFIQYLDEFLYDKQEFIVDKVYPSTDCDTGELAGIDITDENGRTLNIIRYSEEYGSIFADNNRTDVYITNVDDLKFTIDTGFVIKMLVPKREY